MYACPQVESCDQCQRNNKKLQKASGVLHPVPVTSKIWHQVGMDLIGPLTETPRGNKYIITEAGQSTTVSTKKHIFIHLYCTCKMPESYDTRMVQCDDCDTWYHFKCVGIRKEPEHYVCPS